MRQCYNLSKINITGLQEEVDNVKPAMGRVKFIWDGHEEEYFDEVEWKEI